MTLLLIGLVTGFNIIVILMKFNHDRQSEAGLDFILFCAVLYFTSGSQGGLFVGMIASGLVSVYLYFSPPKFLEA